MSTEPNSIESVVTKTPAVAPADIQVANMATEAVAPPKSAEPPENAHPGSANIVPETGRLYGESGTDLPPAASPQPIEPPPVQAPQEQAADVQPTPLAPEPHAQPTPPGAEAPPAAAVETTMQRIESRVEEGLKRFHNVVDEWFAEHFTNHPMTTIERAEWREHERARVSAAVAVLKQRLLGL